MDETPNDSGALPTSAPVAIAPLETAAQEDESTTARWGESGIRRLSAEELRQQVRRPAVWGLLLLIVVVIVVQVWLLFL